MTRSIWYAGIGLLVAAGLVQATTIASFADPTVGTGPPPFMFSIRDGAPGTIFEPVGGPNVTLNMDPALGAGAGHPNTNLVFAPLSYAGTFLAVGLIGPGTFQFFDPAISLVVPVLQIDFDSGTLTRASISGDNIFSANGVTFKVNGVPLAIPPGTGSFTFALVNQTPVPGAAPGFDATASFTASPEPATVVVLAIGTGLALIRRRR